MKTQSKKGFALVLALSVMGFVSVLVLSLAAMTASTLNGVEAEKNRAIAKQNAMLGAKIALAELQDSVGPDTRATALADIFNKDDDFPESSGKMLDLYQNQWVGVWDTAEIWQPEYEEGYKPELYTNQTRKITKQYWENQAVWDNYSPTQKMDKAIKWLVSGNTEDLFNPIASENLSPAYAANLTTYLTGTTIPAYAKFYKIKKDSVSDDKKYILAPKESIIEERSNSSTDNLIGTYAWWVSDEGVKLKVNTYDPFFDRTDEDSMYNRSSISQANAVDVVNEDLPKNEESLKSLIDTSLISLLAEDRTKYENEDVFLDYTTDSYAVLANQKDGGLKKDLTLAFRYVTIKEAVESLYVEDKDDFAQDSLKWSELPQDMRWVEGTEDEINDWLGEEIVDYHQSPATKSDFWDEREMEKDYGYVFVLENLPTKGIYRGGSENGWTVRRYDDGGLVQGPRWTVFADWFNYPRLYPELKEDEELRVITMLGHNTALRYGSNAGCSGVSWVLGASADSPYIGAAYSYRNYSTSTSFLTHLRYFADGSDSSSEGIQPKSSYIRAPFTDNADSDFLIRSFLDMDELGFQGQLNEQYVYEDGWAQIGIGTYNTFGLALPKREADAQATSGIAPLVTEIGLMVKLSVNSGMLALKYHPFVEMQNPYDFKIKSTGWADIILKGFMPIVNVKLIGKDGKTIYYTDRVWKIKEDGYNYDNDSLDDDNVRYATFNNQVVEELENGTVTNTDEMRSYLGGGFDSDFSMKELVYNGKKMALPPTAYLTALNLQNMVLMGAEPREGKCKDPYTGNTVEILDRLPFHDHRGVDSLYYRIWFRDDEKDFEPGEMKIFGAKEIDKYGNITLTEEDSISSKYILAYFKKFKVFYQVNVGGAGLTYRDSPAYSFGREDYRQRTLAYVDGKDDNEVNFWNQWPTAEDGDRNLDDDYSLIEAKCVVPVQSEYLRVSGSSSQVIRKPQAINFNIAFYNFRGVDENTDIRREIYISEAGRVFLTPQDYYIASQNSNNNAKNMSSDDYTFENTVTLSTSSGSETDLFGFTLRRRGPSEIGARNDDEGSYSSSKNSAFLSTANPRASLIANSNGKEYDENLSYNSSTRNDGFKPVMWDFYFAGETFGYIDDDLGKWGDESTNMTLFTAPRKEPITMGDFRHANISHFDWMPAYAVGNSIRPRYGMNSSSTSLEDLYSKNNPASIYSFMDYDDMGTSEGVTMQSKYDFVFSEENEITYPILQKFRLWKFRDYIIDYSYLLNNGLWDGYFMSTISPSFTYQEWKDSPDRDLWEDGDSLVYPFPNSRLKIFESSFDEVSQMPDPQWTEYVDLDYASFQENDRKEFRKLYDKIAKHLLVDGALNVNSTSKKAWGALLGSMRDLTTLNGKTANFAFFRSQTPVGGRGDEWTGFKELTQSNIYSDTGTTNLAHLIVEEVKKRGPFLSLGHFINRSLTVGNDETSYMGAIQAAINNSNINSGMEEFAPGTVTQGDIIAAIAPALTARSDTFKIRVKGESIDKRTAKVKSEAWCELTVQRIPQYIQTGEEGNAAEDRNISNTHEEVQVLTAQNERSGRRLKIVSMRWLDKSETE